MLVEWGSGTTMQPSPIQSRGSHCKGEGFARWGSNQLNCFYCTACTRSMWGTRCMLSILHRPWLVFFWGGGGLLSILGVEHSVCSCSLHESFFLSRPFDKLVFSCTLGPVFSSYPFNPLFFLNSSYSPLALDSDQQKKKSTRIMKRKI